MMQSLTVLFIKFYFFILRNKMKGENKLSNSNYTVTESYTLPSKGLIYDKPVNPNITLRSMTTEEEMRRLAPNVDAQYKTMSDIIEACLTEKPGISVYDMHLGDYQFLLHKLRIVTYGPEYKLAAHCPVCGHIFKTQVNLDEIAVIEYDESIKDLYHVVLPQSGREIELNYQTPRSLDSINKRKKEIAKKVTDNSIDFSLMLTVAALIKTVDGQVLNTNALETFVRKLPMKDTNLLLQKAEKLNTAVGLDINLQIECESCGYMIETPFRFSAEFFGPTIDN